MKLKVKAKHVSHLMAEAKYLQEVARQAFENPDGEGGFLVETEFEQAVVEGRYVGRALSPTKDSVKVMKPGGNYCG